MLNDFHPFGPLDLLLLAFLYLSFDSIGCLFGKFFKLPEFSRLFWWILGLSFYSFFWWFILDQNFNSLIILTSLGFCFLIGLPFQLKSSNLLKNWQSNSLIFLPLAVLSIALYVKTSLPPYWGDEIGYHYYSPSEVLRPELTTRRQDLYFFIPQSLDNVYRLTFAVTNSYAVARSLHLLIVISAFLTVANWLRKHFNKLTTSFWLIFSPFLTVNFTSMATSGLVDMATASTVLVSLLLTWELLITLNWSFFHGIVAFWATSIGFKYSTFIPLLSATSVSLGYLLATKNLRPKILLPKLIGAIPWFLFFGGFWLLRNFLLKGDPIYPMLGKSNFFTGWTIPISINNINIIAQEIFTGSKLLGISLFASLAFSLLSYRKLSLVHGLIISTWFLEILIVRKLGGFLVRYYFHWPYIAGLIMLIPLTFKSKFKYLYLVFVVIVFTAQVSHTIKFVYGSYFTPKLESDYAFRKIDLTNWLKEKYPNNVDIYLKCNKNTQTLDPIYIADPDIMWFWTNSQIQGFLRGCYFKFFDLGFPQITNLPNFDQSFLLYSTHDCQNEGVLPSQTQNTDGNRELINYPYAINQRKLNNNLVCNGEKITPSLYLVPGEVLINEYSILKP